MSNRIPSFDLLVEWLLLPSRQWSQVGQWWSSEGIVSSLTISMCFPRRTLTASVGRILLVQSGHRGPELAR
jgi:hypothetical protein